MRNSDPFQTMQWLLDINRQVHRFSSPLGEAIASLGRLGNALEMPLRLERAVEPLLSAPPFPEFLKRSGRVSRFLKEWPALSEKVLLPLADRGFFPDDQMPISMISDASILIDAGDIDTVETRFAAYFESRVDSIQEQAVVAFPRRGRHIRAAIGAHHRDEYCLTIPVLLSQADGICHDVRREQLYSKRQRVNRMAKARSSDVGGQLTVELVSEMALNEDRTLYLNQEQRRDKGIGPGVLNRHTVMHGEDVDFDTRLNSLKTISFFNFVCQELFEGHSDELGNGEESD